MNHSLPTGLVLRVQAEQQRERGVLLNFTDDVMHLCAYSKMIYVKMETLKIRDVVF